MTTRLACLLVCCMGTVAAPAQAWQITGLSAVEPVAAERVTPAVANGVLRIDVAPEQTITVAPWPAYLPQRFGPQSVMATRQPHPAGPIDRISLRRGADQPAWLEIGAGAQPSAAVVGPWRLQRSLRGWSVAHGKQRIVLSPSAPASVRVGQARWCVYLLDDAVPRPQPGLAQEQEARAAWAAVRLDAPQKRCFVPPAAPR
ncbi:hypothetical protein [Noviherbaspirillum autotrophicum]|uniref:Uncharacterized protein n=1 Tax=Noviherbaspirillum autotrophicum TaxID=709839 RepID=A0A0C1Y781_9BURK|nr:hypothetical protein [Noviherbaspirillum autotrophicum]KIF82768.1 hypothetical protein TSA66_21175 [Noviherbaspirillum autotrophicum]